MRPDLVQTDTPYGRFLGYEGDLITGQLAQFGAHTRNELAMVLDHLGGVQAAVDIGAHVGTFAVPIGRHLGPNGRLLALEGDPATYAVLTQNIKQNGLSHRVIAKQAICGDSSDAAVGQSVVDGNTGASSFAPAGSSPLRTQDTLALCQRHGFARAGFFKIDIEGMELAVLRSILPIIKEARPILYIEVVAEQLARWDTGPDDIDALLRPFGYSFFRNTGARNSAEDRYDKSELKSVADGGHFFDLLALPPG